MDKKGRMNDHSVRNLCSNNGRNTQIFPGLDWGSQKVEWFLDGREKQAF